MEQQVPEIMFQPDLPLHFAKQLFKGRKKDITEQEIEVLLETDTTLPQGLKEQARTFIRVAKQARIKNEAILSKPKPVSPPEPKETKHIEKLIKNEDNKK